MIPECWWGDQNQNQTQSEGINGMAGSLFSVLLLVGKGLSRWLFGDLRSHPSSKTRKRKTDGDSSPGRTDVAGRCGLDCNEGCRLDSDTNSFRVAFAFEGGKERWWWRISEKTPQARVSVKRNTRGRLGITCLLSESSLQFFIFVGRRLSLISEGVVCRVDAAAAGWPHLPGSSVACLFFAKQA